jgi:aspartyl aminopeptidase
MYILTVVFHLHSGGGLWHTMFDRDLGLSGRVLVREGDTIVSRVVAIHEPLLRIPNLAIHLDRSVSEAFKFNNEEQLVPVLCSSVRAELEKPSWESAQAAPLSSDHSPVLLSIIAKKLSVEPKDIFSFELSLCDSADAVIGGVFQEYIFSGRLDNLMMSWCSIQGLLNIAKEKAAELDTVSVAVLFDNEEVGSASTHGADSSVLQDLMSRATESLLASGPLSADASAVMFRNSFLLSCDMAHALHPNYPGKHESNHKPMMHRGLVIKQVLLGFYSPANPSVSLRFRRTPTNGTPPQAKALTSSSKWAKSTQFLCKILSSATTPRAALPLVRSWHPDWACVPSTSEFPSSACIAFVSMLQRPTLFMPRS